MYSELLCKFRIHVNGSRRTGKCGNPDGCDLHKGLSGLRNRRYLGSVFYCLNTVTNFDGAEASTKTLCNQAPTDFHIFRPPLTSHSLHNTSCNAESVGAGLLEAAGYAGTVADCAKTLDACLEVFVNDNLVGVEFNLSAVKKCLI